MRPTMLLDRLPSRSDGRDGDVAFVIDKGRFRICKKYNGQWYCSFKDKASKRKPSSEVFEVIYYIPSLSSQVAASILASGGIALDIVTPVSVVLGGSVITSVDQLVSLVATEQVHKDAFASGGISVTIEGSPVSVALGGSMHAGSNVQGRLVYMESVSPQALMSGGIAIALDGKVSVALGGSVIANSNVSGILIHMANTASKVMMSGGIAISITDGGSDVNVALGGSMITRTPTSGVKI